MAVQESLRTMDPFARQGGNRTLTGRWFAYGAGVVLLLAAAWYGAGLFAPKKKAPPPPPVKVAVAQRRDITVTQNTIGTVVSPAMVQITAQVTGKLLAANFHEGDIVRKGRLLFQIDPAPYQAALAQVEGQLARDEATRCNASPAGTRRPAPMRDQALHFELLSTSAPAFALRD